MHIPGQRTLPLSQIAITYGWGISFIRDEKVIKPEWVLDCVRANKLLPYVDYLLQFKEFDQPRLSFRPKTGDTGKFALSFLPEEVKPRSSQSDTKK